MGGFGAGLSQRRRMNAARLPLPGEPQLGVPTNIYQDYPGITPQNLPLGESFPRQPSFYAPETRGAGPTPPGGKFFGAMNPAYPGATRLVPSFDRQRFQQLNEAGIWSRGMRPMGYTGSGGPGAGMGQLGAGDILKKILLERGYQG